MNILIAIDGSECSEAAVQEVIKTQPKDARIRVMHVIEPLPPLEGWAYAVDWQQILQDRRKEAEGFVADAMNSLREAGFTVATAIEEGIAKSVIVEAASQWPADLVVMGSHGRKGLARFLLGSVSEGVSRHAPCSVLIVRKTAAVRVAVCDRARPAVAGAA
jgi:nucleotide-binding universal stress UspA family protein